MRHIFPVLALTLALVSCGPNVDTRGAIKDPDWKTKVVLNKTTQDEVKAVMGSPSSRSSFGPDTWYYITIKRETIGFLKPEVTSEDVVQIAFSPDNTVKSVRENGMDKSHDFEVSDRVTPTEGHQLTFLEQLLGNVGRFNAPTNSLPGQQGSNTGTMPR